MPDSEEMVHIPPPPPPINPSENKEVAGGGKADSLPENFATDYTPSNSMDHQPYTFMDRLKDGLSDFFADRRKVVITAVIFIFLLIGLTAFLMIKRGSDRVSDTPATTNGDLPIAGDFIPDIFPQVSQPADGVVALRWHTDVPTDGRVHYGLDTDYQYFADDQTSLFPANYNTTHTVLIHGLDPFVNYYFQATSRDAEGRIYRSEDLELYTARDGLPPRAYLDNLLEGAVLSGMAEIPFEALDDQGIYLATLCLNDQPVMQKTEYFDQPFLLDTTIFENGPYTLCLIVSDGVNHDQAQVNVTIQNPGPDHPNSGDTDPGQGGNPIIIGPGTNPGDIFPCQLNSHLTVSIIAPPRDQVLSGHVQFRASVSQNIEQFYFFVNGNTNDLIPATGSGGTYSANINTAFYPDGQHQIGAVAITGDGACNTAVANYNFNNHGTPGGSGINFINTTSTSTTITVSWRTTIPATSVVEYGTTQNLGQITGSGNQNFTTDHRVVIEGLNPETRYYLKLSGVAQNNQTLGPAFTSATTRPEGDDGGPGPGPVGPFPTGACQPPNLDRFSVCYYRDREFRNLVGRATSTNVRLNAAANTPVYQGMPTSNYSVAWEGSFNLRGGRYEFTSTSTGRIRVYVGNQLVLSNDEAQIMPRSQSNSWFRNFLNRTIPVVQAQVRGAVTTNRVNLAPGRQVIKVLYIHNEGSTNVSVDWQWLGYGFDEGPGNGDECVIQYGQELCDSINPLPTKQFAIINPRVDTPDYPQDVVTRLLFSTNLEATSKVQYGVSPNNLEYVVDLPAGIEQELYIGGLEPNTSYYYQITSTATVGAQRLADQTEVLEFRTSLTTQETNMSAAISWIDGCIGNGRVYLSRLPHQSLGSYEIVVNAARSQESADTYRYSAALGGLHSGATYFYRYTIEGCTGTTSDIKSLKMP